MGIFGRSRANTSTEISQPVLTFSDAAPRDDLLSVQAAESPRPHTARAGRSIGGTPGGGASDLRQKPQNVIQAFDFTVTEPPEGPSMTGPSSFNKDIMEVDAIGIALGSPSMVPPAQYRSVEWEASSPSPEKQDTSIARSNSLLRKTSKWKKFGVLLKGKQNEGKPTREGFYQLETEKNHDAAVISDQHHVKQMQGPGAFSRKQENTNTALQTRNEWDVVHQTAMGGSLLSVDIPTVQMERYSVMFRSVLGEKPSSNLLARRSKALDQLQVHGEEPPLPDIYKPQRRATSPATSRSSGFTLFPGTSHGRTSQHRNYNDKVQTSQAARKSPVRSNTFPRAATTPKNETSHLIVPDLTPALSTGTSSGYSSAEPSPIPLDMPITAKDYINGRPEPAWEMITKRTTTVKTPESYNVVSSPEVSARSTPATTPLIQQKPEHDMSPIKRPNKQKALPTHPPRKASLPAHLDRTRVRTRSTKRGSPTKREPTDGDPLLAPNKPPSPNPNPNPSPNPRHLIRSQTMPLPLKIAKKPETVTPNTKTSFLSIEPETLPQTIEISVARSVSVSRRVPRQTLVPLGANPQIFHNENEKFGEHQKRIPTLVDVATGGPGGHRPQKSQDIVIESL